MKVGLRRFGGSSCAHYQRQSMRGEELFYTGWVIQIWRRNRRWFFPSESCTGRRESHGEQMLTKHQH